MNTPVHFYSGGPIFDGSKLHHNCLARFEAGRLVEIFDGVSPPAGARCTDLAGDILSPGFLDLQVNGGDGIMLNEAINPEGLRRIAAAHRRLGSVQILPTLITDTAAKTRATIEATKQAIAEGVPGIAGLHLEGPHLSISRKGAHDADLIRPMTEEDLDYLVDAAESLPALLLTIAPENVSVQQVSTLARAGAIISLGHSDADYETAIAYAEAGASAVTHLFNAMSQLGNRMPGIVGAALECTKLNAGLIADGIHVHPSTMRAAWTAKTSANQDGSTQVLPRASEIFLVSDAMAPAGSDIQSFELEGRRISRENGRLTLEDGTLAGADLDLTTAIRVLTQQCDVPLKDALAAAIATPRRVIGAWGGGESALGLAESQFIKIKADLSSAHPVVE
ncbi:probable n-acetylglucosamine-6-phosphate deacetylase protein [Roseobacter sp. SK209-2-6]|uniref:N-acetylglucosamine-6-phosphate deacetylase n=1 Tax=Roseobacter sp. SK209-2-6 TaxID=388739 RepID=UPI0000F3EEF5|nr:N-acetylglucosamine-6-phosphate deacetylase [Roseobacter sp. SK209-2-6]EBA16847.1 probable n-acetylglucosamine-6-phosphate deacetylase protein [Roseobacter sp. SK209-2-6]